MRILITGSREWTDEPAIRAALNAAIRGVSSHKITVVHGGARGADSVAGRIAEEYEIDVEVHRPDYRKHARNRAPLERNLHMVRLGADICLAFPIGLGWSGTRHCMQAAAAAGIPVVTPQRA